MDPAVMRLISARGGGEAAASLAPMLQRQQSLPPIKINGRSFVKLSLIKQTATSVVHKACAPRDNSMLDSFGEGVRKICAVKKMQLGDDAHAARAREELAILQSLAAITDASNHVVMLLDSESQARELTLVMECGDQDLSNWAPSSSFQMLDALDQAVTALAWLHSVRVAHLDVKPANFLLFPTMNVKLADFGTAMRLGAGEGATLTSDAPFAGTLDYLAPEALGRLGADGQCTASASEKRDVWAMGVMIHTMLFADGRLPFPENGARDVEAQRRVLSAALALGTEGFLDVISDISPACLELTRACLLPSPADRPSAASLLQTVKASCYAQISTAARAPVVTGSSSQEPPPYSATYDSTMPPGWERVDIANGRHYYVDHMSRRTTWTAPTVESPSQGEPPAVSRENSAISMLSVASQEEAEAEVLAAVPAPLPTAAMLPVRMRRQATFQSSQGKLDLLFIILSFVPISELFRARRVCKSWRQRIDGADQKGREWWEVCVQHGMQDMQGRGYDARVDWREILYVGSLLGPLKHAPELFSSRNADGNIITAELMTILLSNLRRAAVIAADSGTLFKTFVSLHSGIFPKCCEIMYMAFTQKPPNNHSALAYDWWTSSTSEVAAEITANLANAPLETREVGAASFDSYVKKMILVLAYLDRFYIQRESLPTLSGVAKPVQAKLRLDLGLPAAVDVA